MTYSWEVEDNFLQALTYTQWFLKSVMNYLIHLERHK